MVTLHSHYCSEHTEFKRSFFQGSFFCALLFCAISYAGDSQPPRTIAVQYTNNYYVRGCQYVMSIGNQEIGMLSSIQMPILQWCIFYDFFVEAAYRGQGHGHFLLVHAIKQAKKTGVSKIFVQPGPFERVAGKYVSVKGTLRAAALNKLIRFYTSHQFKLLSGMTLRCVAFFLSIAYRLAGIGEDPRFLMVYTGTK